MNVERFFSSLALATGLLLCGCSSDKNKEDAAGTIASRARHGLTAEQAAKVLAKVGDATITVGEFADELAQQSPFLRARYESPESRREFLDQLVRFELLSAEARRLGYTELPDVQRNRKQMMIQQMMKAEFDGKVKLADITDQEVERYFNEHTDEFNKPAQVRASHVLVRDEAKARRLLAQVLAKASDVGFFRQAAEGNNEDDATKERFGDLRFFSAEGSPEVPRAVAAAAFALHEIGDVHPELVRTDAGFHIVKLTARRPALQRTLDEVRRPIQNRLWREKRDQAIQQFVDELRRKANVQEDVGALSDLRLQISDADLAAPHPMPMVPAHAVRPSEHAGHDDD